MTSIKLKNIELGSGMPKICVPLTAQNIDSLEKALDAMQGADFDLIEWRADKFDAVREYASDKHGAAAAERPGELLTSLAAAKALIREKYPDTPVIFTVRTSRDMEDFEISDQDYMSINKAAAKYKLGDIIDIEYSRKDKLAEEMAKVIHEAGLRMIISMHIADGTPDTARMEELISTMQQTDADIVKLAVMPKTRMDVLKLMTATLKAYEMPSSKPIITMSMGRLGAVSRVSGALTGSCLSFGTAGAASAPGQIDCAELKAALNMLDIY